MRRLLAPILVLAAQTACAAGLQAWGPAPDSASPDDTGTPTDTGDTPDDEVPSDTAPAGTAPVLASFSASDVAGDLVVLFSASDADGDLEGGTLEVAVDGRTSTFAIPDALASWNGTTGTVRITTSTGGCGGESYDLTGSVLDRAGHRSAARGDSVTIGAGSPGMTAPEVGDDIDDLVQLGTVTAPFTVCGTAWGAGNDGSSYTADWDSLYLTVGASGIWTFELTWESAGDDYDLALWDEYGALVGASAADGVAQPEAITWLVFAGESYYVDVGAWAGSGGPWTIAVYE